MKDNSKAGNIKSHSYKKTVAFIIALSMIVNNSCLIVFAESNKEANTPEISYAESIDNNTLDLSGYNVTSKITVNNMLEQYKFRNNNGHGFAAERGNNLIDKIHGNNAIVVGNDNVKNGADRIIKGPDGITLIQDKYHATAKSGIDACFDEKGNFRYLDGDSNPMQIRLQMMMQMKCMR